VPLGSDPGTLHALPAGLRRGHRRQSPRTQEPLMTLVEAIEVFNQTAQPKIGLITTPDGRTLARLPRLGREIVVKDGGGGPRVASQDIAALCEEAQLAIAPGMALLEAGLAAMGKVARDAEDEVV
jgi:hypothetical protein